MAPKKDVKGKGKGKGKKDKDAGPKGPTPAQLQAEIDALKVEKEKESRDRNRMELDRDKVSTFWEIRKKDHELLQVQLRNKDRELEALEERHQAEIKVFNQKMKHLLYEQQNIVSTVKSDNEVVLKLQREQAAKREADLLNDHHALKERLKEVEIGYEDNIRQMKLDHSKEITKLRQELDTQAKDMIAKSEKKIKAIKDDAEIRRRQEIHEIEERKNSHINELMRKHEKDFNEIKCYYNDITQNNLDLIKTLKEDVTEMKKKEAANEKLMYEIAQENKRLTEPLTRALKEVESLRKQLANYEKDKLSLHQTRGQYADTLKQFKDLEWEYRIMQENFEKVQTERDELYGKFENSIFDVQQKCGLKSLLLEKKVHVLGEELEKKDVQLGEALNASKMEPNAIGYVKYGVEKALETKNRQVKALYYELGKVTKAHNSVVKAFEAKLAEFGIPLQEMGLPHYISSI